MRVRPAPESSSLKCNTVSIHALVRVRHQGLREPCPLLRFNPRTRESATLKWNGYVVALHVSIHALVRVRRKCQTSPARIHGFNPRTRESATVQQVVAQPHAVVSIHALVRVRRPGRLWLEYQQRNGCFAPTSHGGTHIPGRKKEMIVVKIRTPTDYVNRRCPGNFL